MYFILCSYEFDPTKLKDAHQSCADEALREMSVNHRPLVIIDNTNVKNWEYKKYLQIAKDHSYTVLLLESKTPWARDPEVLVQKSKHGLELEALQSKV